MEFSRCPRRSDNDRIRRRLQVRMDPASWCEINRSVRFGDTDAAGVVQFHQLLRWCHEAYEESLERYGIAAALIFPTPAHQPDVALPIVHCSADYRAPLVCGDPVRIQLTPERLDPGAFTIQYSLHSGDTPVGSALTRHLAIDRLSRRRCPLPTEIQRWLEASALGRGVQPL